MTRHAKASPAGSTGRQASGLGWVLRGAPASTLALTLTFSACGGSSARNAGSETRTAAAGNRAEALER